MEWGTRELDNDRDLMKNEELSEVIRHLRSDSRAPEVE